MDKILTLEEAIKISKKLREQGETVVLAGGCFDILHIGHISFLEKAKELGNFLFILLESDKSIKKIKGKNRPINTQKNRAKVLSSLETVNFIINLPELKTNEDYDNLIFEVKPNIIATTKGDPNRIHKERQARMVGATIIDVIGRVSDKSTTNLARLISKDL